MFLGIDIGTQSVKTLVWDPQTRAVVARGAAPLALVGRADGTREQRAGDWLDALGCALDAIDASALGAVQGLGVSGQQHGFVALDEAGEVIAPVKLWCDTSTARECAEITRAFGGAGRCIEELGNPILPGYTAPKIRWLKGRRPDLYARLRTILLPHDYVNFHLTGERAMEYGDASGTGLLDIRLRRWHPGMLAAVDDERDLAELLPPLREPGAAIGVLRPEAAALYRLPVGIPVSTGGGDNMMAAVGTGNVAPGSLTVSLGTSGTMFACSDEPVIDPAGVLAAFCSSTGGWLPLLCTMNCTVATELSRGLFSMDLEQMESSVAAVPPGANGVVTVPFFNGERCPDVPAGRGCVFGLDESNYRRDNLLRSAMESAVYGLRAGLERFAERGCHFESVRLTGGGARSASWRQMVADVFGLPIGVQKVDEGAALGAALHALWTVRGGSPGALVDEQLEDDPARACHPDARATSLYADLYADYLRHVEAAAGLYSAPSGGALS